MPVTRPVAFTVAIPGDWELHVPPAGTSASAVVPATHNDAVPEITGTVLTVTVVVAQQPATPEAI